MVVGGQPGDDTGRGKFVDIGKVKGLHPMVHIVAQIPGEAGGGVAGQHGAAHAKGQRTKGTQGQQKPLLPHHRHIAGGDAVIHQLCHDRGDGHFHGHLSDHQKGAEDGGQLVFPDGMQQFFQHLLRFLLAG